MSLIDSVRDYFRNLSARDWCLIIALPFAILGVALTLYSVTSHCKNYRQPFLQRYVVRILWMVVIYSVFNMLSLAFPLYAIFFQLPRDIYGAYVIYSLFCMMVQYLGGQKQAMLIFNEKQGRKKVRYCFCFSRMNFADPTRVFNTVKKMVYQFSLLTGILTLASGILNVFDLFQVGNWAWQSAYVYIQILRILSVLPAIGGLIQFYKITEEESRQYNLLPKIMCVQFINLISFIQGVFLSLSVYLSDWWEDDPETISGADLQASLLTVEVGLIAIIHLKVFSASEFNPKNGAHENYGRLTFGQAMRDSFVKRDFVHDLYSTFFTWHDVVLKGDPGLEDINFSDNDMYEEYECLKEENTNNYGVN
eukprot:Lithocolla_globosa_v1_NODE_6020_length_1148_cov_6.484904.p1 type:complete len:364 gc:universal NODE_6020_length_1148_cov_6.484904:1112-21(-)